MNQLEADHENLDRLRQDVVTTMTHLQARLKAQLPDIRTYDADKVKAAAVDLAAIVDDAAEVLCKHLDWMRVQLPSEREWRRIEEKAERDRLAKG